MGDPGPVVVLTDSTAALPAGLAATLAVEVVPLQVTLGGRSWSEDELAPGALVSALRAGEQVHTSQPTPAAFDAALVRARATGAPGAVMVHVAEWLSGTVSGARQAAERAGFPVEVVDSGSTGMGLGFAVLAAVSAAAVAAGTAEATELAEVVRAATRAVDRIRCLFFVPSMDALGRGGRLATSVLGTALAAKPLLEISENSLRLVEKVRTSSRGVARLTELATRAATVTGEWQQPAVDVAVQHLDAPGAAAELAAKIRDRVPWLGDVHVCEVGAVLGAHTGPGLLGVAVHRRDVP